jgi:transcriptional regulator with XRE-family HTH domain
VTEAQHIGTRIRELRKAKGLTLQQLADVFGISRASVSEWESGRSKPDGGRLLKLADVLDERRIPARRHAQPIRLSGGAKITPPTSATRSAPQRSNRLKALTQL